jgi:hypothetical protein
MIKTPVNDGTNLVISRADTSAISRMAAGSRCSLETIGSGRLAHFPPMRSTLKLLGTLIAYSGTYVLDGDKITHQIDVSWNQRWIGTNEVRFYKIEDKTLTITTAINKNPIDGREARGVAVVTKTQ